MLFDWIHDCLQATDCFDMNHSDVCINDSWLNFKQLTLCNKWMLIFIIEYEALLSYQVIIFWFTNKIKFLPSRHNIGPKWDVLLSHGTWLFSFSIVNYSFWNLLHLFRYNKAVFIALNQQFSVSHTTFQLTSYLSIYAIIFPSS